MRIAKLEQIYTSLYPSFFSASANAFSRF